MNMEILFWKWIDSTTVGIVSNDAVYHWNVPRLEGKSKKELKNAKTLISDAIEVYETSASCRKFAVVDYDGFTRHHLEYIRYRSNGNLNLVTLYNKADAELKQISADCMCFAELQLHRYDPGTTAFICFIKEDIKNLLMKLFVFNTSFYGTEKKQSEISYDNRNDHIISMAPNYKHHCLCAVTQLGHIFVFDLRTAKPLFRHHSRDVCFVCVLCVFVSVSLFFFSLLLHFVWVLFFLFVFDDIDFV